MRKQRAKLIELVEGLQDQKDPAAWGAKSLEVEVISQICNG
jgi:hypothetical protein